MAGVEKQVEYRESWWADKSQKGRSLADEISELADRARSAGFQTTEYILRLAKSELWKEIEQEHARDKNEARHPHA
jgi:hypothetical protein